MKEELFILKSDTLILSPSSLALMSAMMISLWGVSASKNVRLRTDVSPHICYTNHTLYSVYLVLTVRFGSSRNQWVCVARVHKANLNQHRSRFRLIVPQINLAPVERIPL
jgi:hypothetical protein